MVAYIVRCSGSAMAAYELALLLGLPQAVWAAMSALVVSQEQLHETRSSLTGRILGTLVGMAVTIAVAEISSRVAAPTAVQMGLAVAIAAVVAREFPNMRVVMWTCPIILLSMQPSGSILLAAFRRGGEVILGALVGWVFHWAAEIVVDGLAGAGRVLRRHSTARPSRQPSTGHGPPRRLLPSRRRRLRQT